RRYIANRVRVLRKKLDGLKRQRGVQRRARARGDVLSISLVGYTNAGKSTLFNALVKARSYAADQLFATLDTTTRSLWLGPAQASVSLSDTVGFIRDLPHKLVEAFEATLQEAADADLLLHVIDAASPAWAEQQAEVERVLAEIGADGVPQILVFNKCDRLEATQQPREAVDWVEAPGQRRRRRVFASALTGQGLDRLREAIAEAALAQPPAADAPTLPDGSPARPAPDPEALAPAA
ncbi:MAG: GTPase HflX, partial [Burkholderiales bacterium]|nr:GTPase HflX [Burkholderiales bacterium]